MILQKVNSAGACYTQVYPGEYRYITFNSDGSYSSRGGNNGTTVSCENKSIQQLYDTGRAHNLVTSKTKDQLGLTNMVANWPDAIKCGINTADGAVLILHGATPTGGGMYVQVFPLGYRYIILIQMVVIVLERDMMIQLRDAKINLFNSYMILVKHITL